MEHLPDNLRILNIIFNVKNFYPKCSKYLMQPLKDRGAFYMIFLRSLEIFLYQAKR